MIVAETADHYRFVTQPEHGTQVGRFADRWGNETFAEPTPLSPVVMAAVHHDAGWFDYDLAPHLVDGDPASVLDTTRAEWTRFYDHGIQTVVERDPYAGLLCAMHGAGVRRGRYGTQADLPNTADEFASFIDDQEARQRALVDQLTDETAHVDDADRRALRALHDGTIPDVESGVFRNYRLLQTWDRLSLYCCTTVDHAETTLAPVPVSPDVADTDVSVVPVDRTTFVLDPYPFDTAPLSTAVRTRTVEKSAVDGDEDAFCRAYYAAPFETVRFCFLD